MKIDAEILKGQGIGIRGETLSRNYALALKVFSNSDATAIISSNVGVSPKNMGPSMAW